MTRLSQRTPLRVKLITALLALVALALAVISFTSIAVFRGYQLNQTDRQLQNLQAKVDNVLATAGPGSRELAYGRTAISSRGWTPAAR